MAATDKICVSAAGVCHVTHVDVLMQGNMLQFQGLSHRGSKEVVLGHCGRTCCLHLSFAPIIYFLSSQLFSVLFCVVNNESNTQLCLKVTVLFRIFFGCFRYSFSRTTRFNQACSGERKIVVVAFTLLLSENLTAKARSRHILTYRYKTQYNIIETIQNEL